MRNISASFRFQRHLSDGTSPVQFRHTFRRHFTMPDATLTSQMSALIFKNALLKRRNPRRTVGEVIAIFYFTLIMAFTMVGPMKNHDGVAADIDSPPACIGTYNTGSPCTTGTDHGWMRGRTIAFSPNTTAARRIIEDAVHRITAGDYYPRFDDVELVGFADRAELEAWYINSTRHCDDGDRHSSGQSYTFGCPGLEPSTSPVALAIHFEGLEHESPSQWSWEMALPAHRSESKQEADTLGGATSSPPSMRKTSKMSKALCTLIVTATINVAVIPEGPM